MTTPTRGGRTGQQQGTYVVKSFHNSPARILLGSVSLIGLMGAVHAQVAPANRVNAGEVSASGSNAGVAGSTKAPTQKKIFRSTVTTRVMGRAIIDAAGPVGGAAQVLAYAPGVNVSGYGNTGSTKYTVSLDGLNQGWGGYGGFTGVGALAVTFDGVPIVDPSTDLWQSPTIPQSGMIQNTNVTYGPGDPVDRWYNNIGGGIEFTPVQPTAKPGGDITLTYGSYGQKNIDFDLRTGTYDGWSTVLAGGAGNANSYRTASDGFNSPSENYAVLLKTIKQFDGGNLAFGGYFARSTGYRTPVIPMTPQPGLTITGFPGSPLYSQQTSGFYSNLPFATYEKFDGNAMALVYARGNFDIDRTTTLHDLAWFMHIGRLHSRLNDNYNLGPQQSEYNSPYTNTFGDKLWVTKRLPFNTIDVGGYFIHDVYNSRNNFYNPADGGNKSVVNIGGKIRSSYFNQNDVAVFAQDDISPFSALHITPGIRFVHFQTGYTNNALQDFSFAPGVVLSTHCPLTNAATRGNTKDQGANCTASEGRNGIEPSLGANLQLFPWLAVYGSYAEALRTPQVGGGGGLFQATNPTSYNLELGQEFQAGIKAHFANHGALSRLLFGASYFHQRYAEQQLDFALANGNVISASGTSVYQGANMFLDANPIYTLHVFANASIVNANYTSYITGAGSAAPGTSYNGSAVPYVPGSNLNIGAYYKYLYRTDLIEPRIWYQRTGTQTLFDNTTGAPSSRTMPAFGTINLAMKLSVPLKLPYAGQKTLDFTLTALNVANNKYNAYEYISSGGYFGTATSGYLLAYPGAPFTIYGSVGVHF